MVSEAHGTLPSGVVTFLLTDVQESTRLWERDAAAMEAALGRHDEILADEVTAHGGVLLKRKGEGDSTFSVFGRASDAVAAAVAAQHALNTEPWLDEVTLSVRMAVHTGEAVERDGDYFGRTVNRAARLRSIAEGRHILVSQSTAELVRDDLPPQHTLATLGEFELRDLERPEVVYALVNVAHPAGDEPGRRPDSLGVHVGPASLAGAGRLPLPPQLNTPTGDFVGRSAERGQIDSALEAALNGRHQLVFVVGDAGMGKTRLATEVGLAAYGQGVNVVYGRCDEDLGVPYQPFVEALTYTVRHCPQELLTPMIGGSPGELVRLVPELASRLRGIAAPIAADPETQRYWLFDAVAGWLAAMSAVAPLVLIIDDLHWATTPTLLMLRHLARSQEPMRLLIVGLYRDSEVLRGHPLTGVLRDVGREPNVHRVVLSGLDVTEVGALVDRAASHTAEEVDAGLAEALQTGTGGNPFYVGEILRSLVETDALGHASEHRASPLTIDELSLPETVRAVVHARMSRLSDDANRMLAAAAVAGPSFSIELLESVPDAADDSATLLDALDEAVEAAILVDAGSPTDSYSFVHAVIRQAAYDRLSAARLARLHQQIGDALERMPGDEGARLSGLAYHYAEAARTPYVDKAVDYALRAARHARSQLAFEEAISHLERGLRMFELTEQTDETRQAELLLELADARLPGTGSRWREGRRRRRCSGRPRRGLPGAVGTRRDRVHVHRLERTTGPRRHCHLRGSAVGGGSRRPRTPCQGLGDPRGTPGGGRGGMAD